MPSVQLPPTPVRKQVLPLVLLSLLAALILAGVLETALRVFFGLGHPVLIQRDAACGYTLKPGQDLLRFRVHTHINQYGMRSDDLPAQRDPRVLRLMFLGDSITYGTTRVDQTKIFTHRVEMDLPALLHRPVRVLNASANAWAPDNEVAYVRSRGIFQSGAVILVLNSGDLTQPRASLSQVAGDLAVRNPPLALDEVWSDAVAPFLMRRILHAAERMDAGTRAAAASDTIVQHNLADLTALQSLVTSQHARLIVVYIPFRSEIPVVSGRYLAVLRSWTDAHRVPLIDLTAVEAAHSPREINILGPHLSACGDLLIARALDRDLPPLLAHSS